MEMPENTKGYVAAGLVALVLSVLGLFAGRTYERHTASQSYQEALKQKDEKLTATYDSMAKVMIEKGALYKQLEQMKKSARTWDRGDEYTDAQGIVHKVWDRGDESSEEVVNSLQQQLQETNTILQHMTDARTVALMERDSLKAELVTAETVIKKPGDFRGLLVNWDMEGKTWHTALSTQLVVGLGPWLGSVSLRPGGPFRPSNEGKDTLAKVFDLGPSVGLGLRF